ncbi:NAD(P)/FAD-dependent oxidoreductase [Rhodoligotrophos defluvii]|uniref:NAD(P)/FAD-dependent oxidoreductase n=1 Tax=Rhodoligotrophos defluvii TaxID=2561934 RepID=UPI0010CA152F|nr:FAD-binding oxidoreductase [Rhodoligotrophos defluvii]
MADYDVDVAIIGAGIAGIGIGAELARSRSVLVLEAEEQPGYHATGRSAAVYLKHYGNDTIRWLTARSEAFYLNPPAEVTETPLLSPRGELMITDGSDEDVFIRQVEGSALLREISPREALSLVPILRPEKVRRAAIENASDIDVHALHQGWIKVMRKRGGTLLCNARVSKLTREGNRWLIESPAGVVSAAVVVNAAGAWADKVAAMAGLDPIGLTPCRRSMAVLPAPEGYDVSRWPVFGPARELWYCKAEAGTLYVSPAEEDPMEPHDAYPDDMVLAEGLDRFEQAVTIRVTRIERSWAGLRTFARDRTPVIGFDPAAEGFFWLAGQGGYGIQTSPAASRLASAIILGEKAAGDDERTVRAQLDPARFR